jgi:hypothetical protein
MKSFLKGVILDFLSRVKKAVVDSNLSALDEINNQSIDNASIFQDEDSISIAVIGYSVYKLMSRNRFQKIDLPISFYSDLVKNLEESHSNLSKNKVSLYRSNIDNLFKVIGKLDNHFPMYIEEILGKAKIKKAFLLHDRGISLARSADVLGISQWDLMPYIGRTNISESVSKKVDVRSRLSFARGLFGL